MSTPAQTLHTMCVRSGRVICGAESEPIPEGRHPRVAAVALCERLYGPGKYSLHEQNPWQYSVVMLTAGIGDAPAPQASSRPQDCIDTAASAVHKPEVLHP